MVAGGGAQQAGQALDRRRLAGAVGTEEPVEAARRDAAGRCRPPRASIRTCAPGRASRLRIPSVGIVCQHERMNRLARERSPYLLQHAANPVDWYPWGDEAFEKARREDKPIFLSIGYSTCHWCHVMEHESFENQDVAGGAQRELRLDQGRSRGAARRRPRLHDVRPVDDRVRRLADDGLPHARAEAVLRRHLLSAAFEMGPARVHRSARRDRARLEARSRARRLRRRRSCSTGCRRSPAPTAASQAESTVAGTEALAEAVEQFQVAFDRRHGGFGERRSFRVRRSCCSCCASTRAPAPQRAAARWRPRRCARWRSAACAITSAAASIAIRSTRDWRVPHFEKMLYDQAQLVLAYLEAAQATGNEFFAAVAEDTLAYVARDMRDPAGGFYSAEDADSVPPDSQGGRGAKKEGAFYVWSDAEIGALLGADADVVRQRFGIEPGGNAPQRSARRVHRTEPALHARSRSRTSPRGTGRSADDVVAALGRARQILFDARAGASAAAPRRQGADVVERDDDRRLRARGARAARSAAGRGVAGHGARAPRGSFASACGAPDAGTLLRRYRDGDAVDRRLRRGLRVARSGGCSSCSRPTAIPRGSTWARELQAQQDERFWDAQDGGWFSTTGPRPVGAAAPEGGLRRRRAVGELGRRSSTC